jgi:hypothetical protein
MFAFKPTRDSGSRDWMSRRYERAWQTRTSIRAKPSGRKSIAAMSDSRGVSESTKSTRLSSPSPAASARKILFHKIEISAIVASNCPPFDRRDELGLSFHCVGNIARKNLPLNARNPLKSPNSEEQIQLNESK